MIKENRIEPIAEAYTLEPARYGTTNVIGKKHTQKNKQWRSKNVNQNNKNILGKIETLKIECKEEQILETANNRKK